MGGGSDQAVPDPSATTRVAGEVAPVVAANLGWPVPGQVVDDFELLRLLGAGTFGQVFLARQQSLSREVALKVTRRPGAEAKTLAHLEHDHIVQVFSESAVPESGWHLICMQYVPGTTLQQIMVGLPRDRPDWGSGPDILAVVDTQSQGAPLFDPVAMRERESLATADFADAACRIGEGLAVALAYAHHRGVFHRDIKPANVLLNRYGRPMLVDFNVASDLRDERAGVGGTIRYMAPEHIDALNPCRDTRADAVDSRSDVYSLGFLLHELLAGEPPFEPSPRGEDAIETYELMADQRRGPAPSVRESRPAVPVVLDRTIRRSLHGDPRRRYASASEMAQALAGARHLHGVDRGVVMPPWIRRSLVDHPVWSLVVLAFLPHVFGSAINITFNALQIVAALSPGQQSAFRWTALAYNLVVYLGSAVVVLATVRPVARTWGRLRDRHDVSPEEASVARRRMLRWPVVAAWLAALGWLPGAVIFPLTLHLVSGPLASTTAWHFVVSFVVSGMVALTYSTAGVQYATVRGLYRELWADGRGAAESARVELAPVDRRLARLQLLAGLIPLVGAGLLLLVGAEGELSLQYRLLVCALIGLGMFGFWVMVLVRERLTLVLQHLRGTPGPGVTPLGAPGTVRPAGPSSS